MTLNEEKCPDGQYYCNDSKKCKPIPKGHHVMPDGKLMKGDKHSMNEVAPPTKKHERMVKHIKKSYGKDGGLSDEEKSIAYATAWKNYNKKESFEYEKLKKKIGSKEKHMKPAVQKEMTYQEAIDAGWEMLGDGIWWPPQPETVSEKISFPSFKKKVAERKPQKAMDAGAKAKRVLARKAHAKYVSGSEDNVPDDIRDHKEFNT